ncbi:peptidoglycan recognition protein family protein [Lacticaseibacillus suibinensis]|uniref:peptidoglycan recognition protein family protein n=1 Tax=Lacticaseibacillus suibinensis TaxID=2486011 RepID=UPI000F795EDC|nr:peptidoglycan recognition family protein [Lacticaseibacillus suibinensis]
MAVFSKLTTFIDERPMNGSSHDDPGYPRHKIDRVVIHHNSTTNQQVARDTWLKGGKMTSAHYEITPTQIIGCVDETRSAWHAGNKLMNQRSIGLEHVNSSGAPNWSVAEETLKLSAKLCADICKRYGIPIDSAHIVPHNSIVATDCPGGINMSHYIDLVRQAAGQTVTTARPAPAPAADPSQSASGDLEVDGYFGAKAARRAEALEKRAQDGVISSQDIAWTNAKGYKFIDARALPAVQWVPSKAAVGSQLVGIWQQRLGLPVDYKIGPALYHAALKYYGFNQDNSWTAPSNLVKAMQRQMNKGQKLFS